MKRVVAYMVIGLMMIMGIGCYVSFDLSIHNFLNEYKASKSRSAEYKMMHENAEKIATLPPLEDDSVKWYCNYLIISHSGGVKTVGPIQIAVKHGSTLMLMGTDCLMLIAYLRQTVSWFSNMNGMIIWNKQNWP